MAASGKEVSGVSGVNDGRIMRGLGAAAAWIVLCALGVLGTGCAARSPALEDTAAISSNILNPQRSAAAYTEAVQVSVHKLPRCAHFAPNIRASICCAGLGGTE